MATPEYRVRQRIDAQLVAAGWRAQASAETGLGKGLCLAREFPLGCDEAGYVLFVEQHACDTPQ